MMDTIKHKLQISLQNCRFVPDALTRQSWEYYHGVYLIHPRDSQTGQGTDTTSQSVVLKPLKLGAVKAFLIGELLAAGQKFSWTVLPSPVNLPGTHNYLWCRGNRYLLTAMIKGREADYRRRSDLQAAIRTMKTFHSLTRKLIAGNQKRWAFLRFDLTAEWRKRIGEMEICREIASRERVHGGKFNDEWCRRYLARWPEFYDQAREVVGAMEKLVANPRADTEIGGDVICYHDWAYHNVIIYDGQSSAECEAFLIDFDYIIVDRPVHDQANLISRYLRLNSWSLTSLTQILTDFDRFYKWQPGELDWLRRYLAFPYEYWILGRQYFIEKQPWSMKYYQDQWERKIACHAQRSRALEMMESCSFY
jgi:CotS family spore coat protein